jgi:Kef-type K+ transport system membrane component KefB
VGVLLGRTGLGWIDAGEPTTAFLSEVGFAMLMFVVGTHLPLRHPGLRDSVRPAGLATLLTLAFAVPAGFALALVGPDRPLVLAVVVATSSAAVALPILQGDSDGTATSDSAEGVGVTAGGAVLAAVGEPRQLAQQLVGIAEGFLVPLFFVTLGARLEFGALLGSSKALLLLLAAADRPKALTVLSG